MNFDITAILSNIWYAAIVVFFFGGSIFVHELGHFLAAKWCGLHIDRFSIGFGPKICSWNRKGVEYRLSWLPLGGYVALPQLAEMRGIEGDSAIDHRNLPPISYRSKVIVAVAGAVFNVIFAFLLASLLFFTGRPSNAERASTEIGHLSETLLNAQGQEVPAPAMAAGLKRGDIIRKIDGSKIDNWDHIHQAIALSSGLSDGGKRSIDFTVERDGKLMDFAVEPIISEGLKLRQVGITPGYTVYASYVAVDSPAYKAGIQPGDIILSIDGQPVRSPYFLRSYINGKAGQEMTLVIEREGDQITTQLSPVDVAVWRDGRTETRLGIEGYASKQELIHQTPWEQLKDIFQMTLNNLGALLNRNSDVSIKHMSGPPGIIMAIWDSARVDILHTIWIVILINVSLAFFNLLPIPVLDGGHILFATIQKISSRPLNPNIIASVQGSFMILLFSMLIYVSFFDINRRVETNSEIEEFRNQRIMPVYGQSQETDSKTQAAPAE